MTLFYGEKATSSRNIFALAFLASVIIHVLFFTTLPAQLFSSSNAVQSPFKNKVIRVKRIPPKDLGQIVDIQDDKSVTQDSVETDYLSDKNRRVEKQTRSVNVTREQNQATSSPQTAKPLEKKSKYKLDLSDKAVQQLAQKSGPPIMSQTSMSNYLPEITIGSETLLNTKEFAFHAFYIRMKREIEGFWRPDQAVNPALQIHGTYVTTVNVVLDEQGYLIQAKVIRPSGIEGLDQAAAQAIEKASPFPNPPKELLNDDGRIRVNWNFIFDRTGLM